MPLMWNILVYLKISDENGMEKVCSTTTAKQPLNLKNMCKERGHYKNQLNKDGAQLKIIGFA